VTAATLEAGQLDVSGVSAAIIDTGPPDPGRTGPEAPPVLLLHGSGPGVTAPRELARAGQLVPVSRSAAGGWPSMSATACGTATGS
jgi:hypothetical protein